MSAIVELMNMPLAVVAVADTINTFWPQTIGGWVGTCSGMTVLLMAGAGLIVFMERKSVEAINARIKTIDATLSMMQTSSRTSAQTTLKAIERVEALEIVLNNGLTSQSKETREDVEEIKEGQVELSVQIAEIHGWLKASQKYDGKDRREN